mmetsp:Transcript_71558/g.141927  ORF Transcript_71558/g.141927 Transcript_71558/m.141927 type:complete len:225 (-) Transcript_71558:134-808(-)
MGHCGHKEAPLVGGHTVQLAVSPIGPPLGGQQGYHTSVVVDTHEYYFTEQGIEIGFGLESHSDFAAGPDVLGQGASHTSGEAMAKALRPHFAPKTYDLLRKNCNTFTDCALFFLLGMRLDRKYRALEKLTAVADDQVGLLRMMHLYTPNPEASGFETRRVVNELAGLQGMPRQADLRWSCNPAEPCSQRKRVSDTKKLHPLCCCSQDDGRRANDATSTIKPHRV